MGARAWGSRALALVALAGPPRAFAQSEAELLVAVQSDDLLTGTPPARNAPWRAIASRDAEPENRARVGLELREVGFWPSVSTSALLRVEVPLAGIGSGEGLALRDASSSIALAFTWRLPARLALRAFPFDTDYWRVGHVHALDLGGTNVTARDSIFLNQKGGVPGALVDLALPRVRIVMGAKWTQSSSIGAERLWGFLARAQLEPNRAWRFDLGLGYFERPELSPGAGFSAPLAGGSLRVVLRRGVSEPRLGVEPFRRGTFAEEAFQLRSPSPVGEALALEATTLLQRQNALEDAPSARWALAPAGALYGSIHRGAFQGHFALLWRSLRFLLRNERPALNFASDQALEHAELGGWLGGSITPGPPPIAPGCEVGVVLPAALETASALPDATQSFVAGPAGLSALPVNARVSPLLAARVSLRVEASRSVVLGALIEYVRDPNATRLLSTGERDFAAAHRLSVQLGSHALF